MIYVLQQNEDELTAYDICAILGQDIDCGIPEHKRFDFDVMTILKEPSEEPEKNVSSGEGSELYGSRKSSDETFKDSHVSLQFTITNP